MSATRLIPRARREDRSRSGTQLTLPANVGSFRRQLVLSTAALGAAVAVILIVVVQVALSRTSNSAVIRVLDDRADAVISSADAATGDDTLSVPDSAMDAGVAVYAEDGTLVAGSVPPSQASFFHQLATTRSVQHRRLGDAFELLGAPFTTTSGATGVVVISERLEPYQDDVHYAVAVSVAAGVVIVLLATALAAWASRRALAPVAEMARTAEDWSAHNLDRRFDLGPPTNEIRALGHTMDALLERAGRAILDEQRLTSELAHELRTPLTAVLATAEVIAMRDDLDEELTQDLADITESCRTMAATVTGLLDLARSQSTDAAAGRSDLTSVIEGLLRDLPHRDKVDVRIDPGTRVAVGGDLVARAIGPVLDNATRLADHVRLTGRRQDRWVELRVVDDGPGVAAGTADVIFEPGHTGGSGSGLGLALARRVARSFGGDVTLDDAAPGSPGAAFVVRLPGVGG